MVLRGNRANSILSPDATWSQRNRKRWLEETYKYLIEDKNIVTDFRTEIVSIKTGQTLMKVGALWNNLASYYLPKDEEDELDIPIKHKWFINPPQEKLFALLPMQLDTKRKIPLTEVMIRAGRRTGKTFGTILYALAVAVVQPFSKIVVFGMDHNSNMEMLTKISASMPVEWYSYFDAVSKTLYMRNGSTIQFFSQRSYKRAGRGLSADLVILDEFSVYENPDMILEGVKASLVELGGIVIALYTPSSIHTCPYYEEQKAKSPDPELNKSVKTIYFGPTTDNVVLSERAIRQTNLLAKSYSQAQYDREILGLWTRATGICFPDFQREKHVLSSFPEYYCDITKEYCRERWEIDADYICGMDFNTSPTSFSMNKIGWSPSGGDIYCVGHLEQNDTTTPKFIETMILPWLRTVYPNLDDSERVKKIIIVADASSWYAGAGQGTRNYDAFVTPHRNYLVDAGFEVIKPRGFKRRVNRRNKNVADMGGNPKRADRYQITLSRILDRMNIQHYFVLDTCSKVIEVYENHVLYNGLPDLKSGYAHTYDCTSYVLTACYSSIQLYAEDAVELTRTYEIVYEIGLNKMTPEQRAMHPVVKMTGKELLT